MEFDKLEMKDNKEILEYITRTNSIVNWRASNREIMEIEKIVEKIMRSPPNKFNHVIAAIEKSQYLSSMSLESLQRRMEVHEIRIFQRSPQITYSHDQALKLHVTFRRDHDSQLTREIGVS